MKVFIVRFPKPKNVMSSWWWANLLASCLPGVWNFTDPFKRWISMACLGVWRNTFSSHCGVASQIWADGFFFGNLPWKCFTKVPPKKTGRFFSISENCIEKHYFSGGHVVNVLFIWSFRIKRCGELGQQYVCIYIYIVLGREVLT